MVFSYQRLKKFFSLNNTKPPDIEVEQNIFKEEVDTAHDNNYNSLFVRKPIQNYYFNNKQNVHLLSNEVYKDTINNEYSNNIENRSIYKKKSSNFPYLIILPLMYLIIHFVVLMLLVINNKYYGNRRNISSINNHDKFFHNKNKEINNNINNHNNHVVTDINGELLNRKKYSKKIEAQQINSNNSWIKANYNSRLTRESTKLKKIINTNESSNLQIIPNNNTAKSLYAKEKINAANISYIDIFYNFFSFSEIYCFFTLLNINTNFFFVSTCLTTLIGMFILVILYSILKQRYNVPEYKPRFINLYIMLVFGIMTNFLNFLLGFYPFYLKNIQAFDQLLSLKFNFQSYIEQNNTISLVSSFGNVKNEFLFDKIDSQNSVSIKQILFLCFICISSLYSIVVVFNVRFLKKIKSTHCLISQTPNEYRYLIKILILIIIVSFTTLYISCLLHKNEMIDFDLVSEDKLECLYYFIPYVIYFLLGVLMFSFYFELKFITYKMSRNMEVDYLFEKEINKDYI